ncbi:hypothetical protein [Phenylobacterium sp.]|uniref:hypothetical protein n=1 Tax=Phenylobacterium sp. TaxID=1871053 RepID=UPI003D296490
MSDIPTNSTAPTGRSAQAKELIGQAGQTLKAEAKSFANVAQDRVQAEARRGAQAATKTLGDFANAVRRAGDELDQNDQTPASRLVRQAADGLESLSRNLADKEPGDLMNAVRDFGRKNPAAFIGGAVLLGLAIGRFARASEPASTSGLGDADLTLADADMQDASPTAAFSGGLAAPLVEDAGEFKASDADADPALAGDDGTSGLGETYPTTTPPTGGR